MNRVEMVRRLKAVAGRPEAASRPWYRVTAHTDDAPARIDVYDEIGGSWFSDGVSASDFVAQLAAIPSSQALEVHINSPGGDVFDGIAIYNAIAQRPGPVTTIVDGLAASAASFIAQAGKTRVVSPGSMMMIHDASGLCIGNSADMLELAGLLDQVSGNLADIYAAHAGKTAADWRDAMQAETWYKAADAVSAGLADQLADRPAPKDAAAKFDLSVFAKAPAWLKAAGPRPVNAPGKAYEAAPYSRDPDETVQCPECQKFNDVDAAYCDQCGTELTGRDDVEETTGDGAATALSADEVRALVREELSAAAAAPGNDGGGAGAGDGTNDHADMPAWLRNDA